LCDLGSMSGLDVGESGVSIHALESTSGVFLRDCADCSADAFECSGDVLNALGVPRLKLASSGVHLGHALAGESLAAPASASADRSLALDGPFHRRADGGPCAGAALRRPLLIRVTISRITERRWLSLPAGSNRIEMMLGSVRVIVCCRSFTLAGWGIAAS